MSANGPLRERVRRRLIGTPLERPAKHARRIAAWLGTARHPELRAVFVEEPAAIDALLERVIAADMHCVDAGAHLGSVTAAIHRLAPAGRHLAIEPTPYKAAWLREKFPDVEIAECAVGAAAGFATFFHHARASGYSGLRPAEAGGPLEPFEVAVRTLDELIPAARRIGFLKIDVEGGELDAFRGAPRILGCDRPAILFECTLTGLGAFGQEPAAVHAFLAGHGYAIYTPADRLAGRRPLDVDAFDRAVRYPFRAFNFAALPRG
jgi:FkbM family methyltransferase